MALASSPITSLKVAIVNDEIESIDDCLNNSAVSVSFADNTCKVSKASCLWLNKIHNTINKQHFATFDEGYNALKAATVVAFIHIKKNFSEATDEILKTGREKDLLTTHLDVDVYNDRTNFFYFEMVRTSIDAIHLSFYKSLFEICNLPSSFLKPPITYEKPIYGTFEWRFEQHFIPILIVW